MKLIKGDMWSTWNPKDNFSETNAIFSYLFDVFMSLKS